MRLMIVLLAVISVIFLMIGPTKANKEHPALRSSQHGVHTAAADYWHVIEDIATSNFHSPHHHVKFEDKVTEIANTAATIKSDTQSQHNSKKVIAYAITVTKDGPFVDGALVLGHAAKKYHGPDYDVDLVAFVAPTVHTSRSVLEKFGWKILERQLPVKIEEIENKDYAEKMRDSGCCGADEFLKLWAYTLVQYHRVIHLDMDSIIFKNMDDLFEQPYELLFTGDYNMKGSAPVPPAQGGFLVIRPSIERFKEYQAIIRKGDYGGKGWGGTRIGKFWGGQTIQGIVPYFYYAIHPGEAKEMNRCEYNCMVDNPYYPNTNRCINGEKTCEDCRAQDASKVYSAHFTICQKPWNCNYHNNPRNQRLCKEFHDKWFALRDDFERSTGMDTSYRVTIGRQNVYPSYLGMCTKYSDRGYLPIPINMAT